MGWGYKNPWGSIGGAIKSGVSGYVNKATHPFGSGSAPKVVSQNPKPAPNGALVTYDNNGNPIKDDTPYGVQILGPNGSKYADDASIAKSRHANDAVYRRMAELQKQGYGTVKASGGSKGGSGGSGGGGGLGSMGATMLALASNPYDRALKQLGLDYSKNVGDTKLHGKRADADLAQLFSRLGNYEQTLMDAGRRDYAGSGKSLARNYDALLKSIQGDYQQGAGNTTAELQRLGINEVSPAAMAGLAQDALFTGNQAKIGKSEAIGNNNANADLFKSVMREMMGSASVEGTTQRGRNKQATADQLNTLLNEFTKGKTDLAGKKSDALLQARLQLQQQAAARAERAAARAASAKAAGGAASARKPSGYADAIAMLQQASGGDQAKFQNMFNLFTGMQGGSYDDRTNKNLPKNLLQNYKTDFSLENPALAWHLQNVSLPNWQKKFGYGPQDMEALRLAIAAATKKY